jgi:hypothetical protein
VPVSRDCLACGLKHCIAEGSVALEISHRRAAVCSRTIAHQFRFCCATMGGNSQNRLPAPP